MADSERAGETVRRTHASGLAGLVFVGAILVGIVTGHVIDRRLSSSSSAALANLDSDLLGALRQAAREAAKDGVEIVITSGWRSPGHQERLFRQAVSKYGSKEKAARWVAAADTSLHVSGHAVDIGPTRAMAWLSRHGAQYGLCQIYRNEPWHYELRPEAIDDGCPSMYADPGRDPRMRQ